MKVIRENKQNVGLITKYGKCKKCNGRGYLGTSETGYNCHVCKGTGAKLRSVPTWRKAKK